LRKTMNHKDTQNLARVFDRDEVAGVLSGSFYAPDTAITPKSETRQKAAKPEHYKVICISMYTQDLDKLDQLVGDLKARGYTKANRSALIRAALEQVDLSRVPKGI
jgi:hypothetical protein